MTRSRGVRMKSNEYGMMDILVSGLFIKFSVHTHY